MANARNASRRKSNAAQRDAGGFIALPWAVIDSPAYAALSMHARALLVDIARQYVRDNNGRLLLTRERMAERGWKSNDMLTKARRELEAAGFLYQTVRGHRPSKASWFAVTWAPLDVHPGFDLEALANFQRSAYKNASLGPPHGVERLPCAPPHGVERPATTPPHGAHRGIFDGSPTPSHGHHLEKPSTGSKGTATSTNKEPVMATQTTTAADHGNVIESLDELWQRVGIRAMALPKIGRAGAVQADKTAAGRHHRLSVARAAQEAATTRHAIKPLPVLADPDDDRHVDRSEAQDLHAWND